MAAVGAAVLSRKKMPSAGVGAGAATVVPAGAAVPSHEQKASTGAQLALEAKSSGGAQTALEAYRLEAPTVVVDGGTETASSEAVEAYRVMVLAHLQRIGGSAPMSKLGTDVPRSAALKKWGGSKPGGLAGRGVPFVDISQQSCPCPNIRRMSPLISGRQLEPFGPFPSSQPQRILFRFHGPVV